ncbi:MAG: altronate dehydratase [Clostridia bacterium]|nr:altronate dehydratase [Clostridia bacterium]
MKIIRIEDRDSVAVCPFGLKKGESDGNITAQSDVPAGHKIALIDIEPGEKVFKYAYPIGHASKKIGAGEHVHSHNLVSDLGGTESWDYAPLLCAGPAAEKLTFSGFRRSDGKVGIRNEIWIIPTVGCAVPTARAIKEAAGDAPENVKVKVFSHSYGCSQLGGDLENTLRLLASLAKHPNAAGTLIVGLGCENGNVGELKKRLGDFDDSRILFLEAQSEDDEIKAGVEAVKKLLREAARAKRSECGAEDLVIGLKCGGSDGLSGVTANPLIGTFTDRLISSGGSAALTEVPEMFGAERALTSRCVSREVFGETVKMINGFREYFMKYGEKINENPSPGNRAGGITTLEEKSLGCVRKGGSAPITDVVGYAGQIRKKGLTLLCAPGNDLVSSTALAAAGCQAVLFSTGRGTPFSCPVPTVKISSNSALFEKKKAWIDFDAGRLLAGEDRKALSDELTGLVLGIASGKETKGEKFDNSELAIFKDGVTL